jgi:hypothetical protein
MCIVDAEIDLAAKTTGAVVEAIAHESGALGPVRAYAEAVTVGIHYRYYPRVIRQALAAARRIEESGLPRRAYTDIPDPLLRSILEEGGTEDDPELQTRWANLLANLITERGAAVRRAFPRILSELEPVEALMLDGLVDHTTTGIPPTGSNNDIDVPAGYRQARFSNATLWKCAGGIRTPLDNLYRLQLLQPLWTQPVIGHSLEGLESQRVGARFTQLGWDFVQACRAPCETG